MIDTHCHLDSERFAPDRAQVLERAWAAGLSAIVLPGIGPANWEPLLELGAKEPRLWVALGIHPQLLPELSPAEDDAALERLDQMLASGRCVAVGECGLDGPSSEGAPLDRQREILRAHFALARKHGLPLLVHCLKAHGALTELLEQETLPPRGLLLHSYSGGAELVVGYARKGCHFSFAGPISYPGSRKPLAALRAIPSERLMAETDAPDQAPAPHRGQRSEPAYVQEVVAAMARALDEPFESVAERTSRNARTFFGRPANSQTRPGQPSPTAR